MNIMTPRNGGIDLAKALGIPNPEQAKEITLTMTPGAPVTVVVTYFVAPDVADTVRQFNLIAKEP